MGKAESKEVQEDEQYDEFSKIAQMDGPNAVSKYLKDNMERWKKEQILFAVTGRTATGKSTFINKIRNVKPGDQKFAKTGSGNTTKSPKAYQNPKNERIVFVDLPGIGTMEFKKQTYVSDMKLQQYDYFFIFIDKVVNEDDYFLVCELVKMQKSFSIVRSKIDDDLRNAKEDGQPEEKVLPEIKEKIYAEVYGYTHLRDTDSIFLISSRREDIGDWCKLLQHIQQNLPAKKYESLMYSLPILAENVIDLKYEMLKKRIKVATLAAASISAVPIPGVDLIANTAILVEEVSHYIGVFGLGKEMLSDLDGFDRNKLTFPGLFVPDGNMAKIVISQLGKFAAIAAIESVADVLIPIIGSIVSATTTAVITYRFLCKTLDELRHDAVFVYRCILQKHRVID